ncbi:MAG TPA: ribosome maturation factor RimM [Terriglobales bacterium]|nr:ribosome maturation factor RimM [Terriglobales bacterium]
MTQPNSFTAIARIVRPQGRRGELLAELLTDFPEKFAERRQLWLSSEAKPEPREYSLENHWLHKGRIVLKFAGIDSISSAEALSGMLVQIPTESRSQLEAGAAYISDLIGSTLFHVSQNRNIGTIRDVQQGAGTAPLLIVDSAGTELEIPFAEEFIVRFDSSKKLLEMKLPQGLLEVNDPLTENEKAQQRSTPNEDE